MLLQIAQAIPPELLTQCLALTKDGTSFVDGRDTAGWHARERKHNLQARPSVAVDALLKQVEKALLRHELVAAAARPKNIVRMQLSRYEKGMSYGAHVDDAIMQGQRTDLSFTLFLNPPEAYEGGALVIDEAAGERAFRMEAGALLLYPSTTLHRVEEVTSGERLVIVGWIRSYIPSAQDRELLFDLERIIAMHRQQAGQESPALELLLKTRSNLLRRWAQD
ncbi:MAG: Fe2+-dependent dioxygenase [Gammaproteobacteria bacterium]